MLGLVLSTTVSAATTLTVSPITWNVIGLDSNSPTTGPKNFPVGARVCSSVATTGVTVNFVWDSTNANVNTRTGSASTLTLASLAAGACSDAYFEVEVTQVAAAYNTARRYYISATDASGTATTPKPRELFVEHLISQSRNSITGIKLDGVVVPVGGAMNLKVGKTYAIELDGGTATQGYEQFEAFINFPNTIFQILSVATTYSADDSAYIPGPPGTVQDKLYADACLWENAPSSPNYRACVGVAGSAGKAGGNTVVTTYTIKIIGGAGTSVMLNSLLYDFSGSSFHYNGDFSSGARIANIVDSAAALTFSKAFLPSSTVAGGTSTLKFQIANSATTGITDIAFTDNLPSSPAQMLVASPANFSTSGCGSPTFAPTAGATSISFSGGTIAAGSSCTVTVNVQVPASPASGSYVNTSQHLFAGGIDTGKFATATLTVAAVAAGTGACGLPVATWRFPTGFNIAAPANSTSSVTTATAVIGAGLVAQQSSESTLSSPTGTSSWGTNGAVTSSATLDPANNDYFEFAITTTGYTSIAYSFQAQRGNVNGPLGLGVYVGTSNARPETGTSVYNDAAALTTNNWTAIGATTVSSGLNASGVTYFRIYGFNSKNETNGSDLNIDNVVFTGCRVPPPPTLVKAFAPASIAVNGTSTLTFTLTNPNAVALTGAKFNDILPAGLEVAATPAFATTCTGSPTWAPVAGATSLAFGQATGATIPANGSCTASVSIKATTAGAHTNVSDFISATESGTNSTPSGSATASLTALTPPSIAKGFGPNPILAGANSLLTFTITNPNTNDALSGVAFSDTYPAGLLNVNPLSPAVTNTCGGSVSAVAGGGSISLSAGTIAANSSCTISVTVRAAAAGSYANTSAAVSASTTGQGNTASSTLVVNTPNPSISLLKQVSTSASGPWLRFLTTPPGSSVYYQFTVENTGDVPFSPISVSDPTVSASGCTWPTTLPVASATQSPTATCVIGPVNAVAGDQVNTAVAQGTFNSTSYASPASSAEYIGAVPGFSLLKQISTSATGPWSSSTMAAFGGSVYYKFTLVNTGNVSLSAINVTDNQPSVVTSSCVFTDPLAVGAATVCIIGPITASSTPGTVTNTATGHGSNGATVVDTAPSSASYSTATSTDLSISKTDGSATYTPGASISYAIVVGNNGPSNAVGASVADTVPAAITGVSASCVASGTANCGTNTSNGNAVSFTGIGINNGSTNFVTITVNGTVSAGAIGNLVNTATVTAGSGQVDPTTGNNSATDTDTPAPLTDLSITKTDNSATYTPGASISYAIVVGNNGPSNAAGASVDDAVPAAITGVSTSCVASGTASCGSNVNPSGNTVSFTGVNINAGAANFVTITVSGTVNAGASGNLSNTATVTAGAGQADPFPTNNFASDTDTPVPLTDLSISKSDGSTTYTPGAGISYAIVVGNAGPTNAIGASVADTVPAAITGVTTSCVASGTAVCGTNVNATGNAVSFTGVNINAGAANFVTITVSGTVSAGATGDLVNTATVTAGSGQIDPTPGNNFATDTDTPAPKTDLSITKTDNSTTYTPGNAVSYAIVVGNNGPSNAVGASVADTVPAAITGVTTSCVASGTAVCGTNVNATGNAVSFTGVNINAGAANFVTITVSGTVSAGATGDLVNTATVTAGSGQIDPTPGNNFATDTDTPAPKTDLSITKTDNSTTYTPGNAISYAIVVGNNGPSNAVGASVADTVPAAITGVTTICVASGTAVCGTNVNPSGNTVSFTGVNINAGAGNFVTIMVSGTVNAGATGNLVNTATVTAGPGQTDPTPGNNGATDTDTPAPVTDLSISKTDGSTTYTPGAAISYAIVVGNNGPSNAMGASVADSVPAAITGVTTSCVASGTAICGTNGSTGNAVSFSGINVNAGAANFVTITVSGTVSPAATGNLVNTATVTAGPGQTDPTPGNNGATDTDTPAPVTDLSITKSDGSTTYTPGNAISYAIVVGNNGPSNAVGASVADAVPAAITGTTTSCVASGTAICGTNGSTGNAVSFTGINVNAGTGNFVTITVSGTVSPGASGNLVNTATVAAGPGQTDPATGNNSATDTDTLATITDLTITKTDGSPTYTPGTAVSYAIVVGNNGPSNALAASVTDTVPAVITGVTSSCVATGTANCGTNVNPAGNAVSLTGVNINAGAGNFITLTVSGMVSAGATGNLVNSATVNVGAGQIAPTSTPKTATDTDTAMPVTDLSISKSNGSTTYTPGAAISYAIVVGNAGPSNAVGASVADAVPATITGVVSSCVATGAASCGANNSSGNAVSFTGNNINAGAGNFVTITVSGMVSAMATGNLVNTATVTAGPGQTDPAPGNNSATDTDTPLLMTNLSITKMNNARVVYSGATPMYTITVTNLGPSNVAGAMLNDIMSSGLSMVSISCSDTPGKCVTPPTVTQMAAGNFVLPMLQLNETYQINVMTLVTATGGMISNAATVTAPTGTTDFAMANNASNTTDAVMPMAIAVPYLSDWNLLLLTILFGVVAVGHKRKVWLRARKS